MHRIYTDENERNHFVQPRRIFFDRINNKEILPDMYPKDGLYIVPVIPSLVNYSSNEKQIEEIQYVDLSNVDTMFLQGETKRSIA